MSVSRLRFARREVERRSNPVAGAATRSSFNTSVIRASRVTGLSNVTDHAQRSRREHLALLNFRLRNEVGALTVGGEPDTARCSGSSDSPDLCDDPRESAGGRDRAPAGAQDRQP